MCACELVSVGDGAKETERNWYRLTFCMVYSFFVIFNTIIPPIPFSFLCVCAVLCVSAFFFSRFCLYSFIFALFIHWRAEAHTYMYGNARATQFYVCWHWAVGASTKISITDVDVYEKREKKTSSFFDKMISIFTHTHIHKKRHTNTQWQTKFSSIILNWIWPNQREKDERNGWLGHIFRIRVIETIFRAHFFLLVLHFNSPQHVILNGKTIWKYTPFRNVTPRVCVVFPVFVFVWWYSMSQMYIANASTIFIFILHKSKIKLSFLHIRNTMCAATSYIVNEWKWS